MSDVSSTCALLQVDLKSIFTKDRMRDGLPSPSKADNPIQDRNEEMLAIKLMRDDDIFWQLKGWTNMTIKR